MKPAFENELSFAEGLLQASHGTSRFSMTLVLKNRAADHQVIASYCQDYLKHQAIGLN